MEKTLWTIDPAHSEIHFKVKHLMITNVTGQFNRFSGTVETDGDDLSTAKVHFTAEINSISTNNEQRDAHLRNVDFFDATVHPELIFEGDQLTKIDDENYLLEGTLTMRGISKHVQFNAENGGMIKDPWGNIRVGFTVSGKIHRKDFGVSFGLTGETGNVLLSDEVKINASAQFVKQAGEQTENK
jgi:polyisoprenoid-binding protein YceI